MRRFLVVLALMICVRAFAQDASLVGAWQLQTPQLWQQLELNKDGTYLRSIVTTGGKRTEIGRWHSDISVLVLQPDHVITTQGARVPLPPRDKQIDVAGVDASSLTLYYDGDAVETWQRLPRAVALPASPPASSVAAAPTTNSSASAAKMATASSQWQRSRPRVFTIPVPQARLAEVRMEVPAMPDFLIAARTRTTTLTMGYVPAEPAPIVASAMPVFAIAAEEPAVETPRLEPLVTSKAVVPSQAPPDLYPEARVVDLITQIACEELRYPQRNPGASLPRYQRIAQSLGFDAGDPEKLQRTLRYYQSNAKFLQSHQHAIAENSLRCAMTVEQVSTVQ